MSGFAANIKRCDYYGCNAPMSQREVNNLNTEQRFCDRHLNELNKLLDAKDVKGTLQFWVDSNGGAKNMVSKTAEEN